MAEKLQLRLAYVMMKPVVAVSDQEGNILRLVEQPEQGVYFPVTENVAKVAGEFLNGLAAQLRAGGDTVEVYPFQTASYEQPNMGANDAKKAGQ